MRIVSWNPGAAYGPYVGRHDEAWRYLESLEPDIALLQECVPAAWALRRWTVVKPAFSFWTTAVAVPARPTTEVAIPKGNLLARFRGFAAAAEVTVPGIGPVVVVSVHASAHPANARTLRGLDPAALRRPSATEPWWNDLFFAGAAELVAGRRVIVGGDWNTARYVDTDGIPTPPARSSSRGRPKPAGSISTRPRSGPRSARGTARRTRAHTCRTTSSPTRRRQCSSQARGWDRRRPRGSYPTTPR